MGIDTDVFIAKSDLVKLMRWEVLDLYNNLSFGRWYNVVSAYKLSSKIGKITLQELVKKLAEDGSITPQNRKRIMDCYECDIILQADTVLKPEGNYIDLRNFVNDAISNVIEELK